jgi:phosphohistidine phosphatase
MKLLVVRHAIAEDRDLFAESGKPDKDRPLTAPGRRKMARAADGLRALVPRLDLLASSPLVRAQQTAAIVAKAYGIQIGETTDTLEPGSALSRFAEWARGHAGRDVVAVVGHEPHLSTLVTWLMSRVEEPRVELKKGGACLLELDGTAGPASAKLVWLNAPRALRELAG